MKYFIQFNVRGTREQIFKVERAEMKKKTICFWSGLGGVESQSNSKSSTEKGRTEVLSELCS